MNISNRSDWFWSEGCRLAINIVEPKETTTNCTGQYIYIYIYRIGIVQLYGLHRDDDNYYLAMELVVTIMIVMILGEGEREGEKRQQPLQHWNLPTYFWCACNHDTSEIDSDLPEQEFVVGACSFLCRYEHMVTLGSQFELQRMLMEKPSLVNIRDYDFRTPLGSCVFVQKCTLGYMQSFLAGIFWPCILLNVEDIASGCIGRACWQLTYYAASSSLTREPISIERINGAADLYLMMGIGTRI